MEVLLPLAEDELLCEIGDLLKLTPIKRRLEAAHRCAREVGCVPTTLPLTLSTLAHTLSIDSD